jgi:signal transduction histidine kinase
MIASAMAVRRVHGPGVRCVFIGPCVAKKQEARALDVPPVVDEVLTFQEVRRLLAGRGVELREAQQSGFDPPRAALGRAYPLVGGLLRTAGMQRDPLQPEVIVLSGQAETIEVLGGLRPAPGRRLVVEAMMCRGCFSGPGMYLQAPRLARKTRVADYVNGCRAGEAEGPAEICAPQELARSFSADDQRLHEPTDEEIRTILAQTNKFSQEDELNCGACGYATCRAKAVAVYRGMAEEAMCLPFMVEQAERVCHELKVPWAELREIHRHLINTEKLASMGQMAAGVAHELNNPLSTILLYANILRRKLQGREELHHDLRLVEDEAQRCKKIIGMLLDFARQNRVRAEPTDMAGLLQQAADESLHLLDGAVRVRIEAEPGLRAELDRDQMAQVLGNLVKNALESMQGRSGEIVLGAHALEDGRVRVSVADQGCGIPAEARDRIFQPFFTTKSLGKGTGLGLPISYGIVKMHRGTIWFQSEAGQGTTFHIELPSRQTGRTRSMFHGQGNDSVCG